MQCKESLRNKLVLRGQVAEQIMSRNCLGIVIGNNRSLASEVVHEASKVEMCLYVKMTQYGTLFTKSMRSMLVLATETRSVAVKTGGKRKNHVVFKENTRSKQKIETKPMQRTQYCDRVKRTTKE